MARIQAGSTLVNQYAPPFVVSGSVSTGWELRWNDTLKAFEAYDPSANVVQSGFGAVSSALFLNASQQVFVVPFIPDTTKSATEQKASFIITIQGVKQHQSAYTILVDEPSNTTRITLSENVTNEDVEVIGLLSDEDGGSVELYSNTGDGAETDYTLTWLAASEASLIVTIDGVKQNTDAYSITANPTLTATILQFVAAPGIGEAIEVIGIQTRGETPASPVEVVNIDSGSPGGTGLFGSKTLSGDTQIFSLKDIVPGTNVTIDETATTLTINSVDFSVNNLGTGTPIAPTPGTLNPLNLRVLAEGEGVSLTVVSDAIVVAQDYGYGFTSVVDDDMAAAERVFGVRNTGAPVTVTLPPIASVPAGGFVTVKDETGGAGTNNITVDTAAAETIDGAATTTISTNYGYVTLYSNGTNYFIASAG